MFYFNSSLGQNNGTKVFFTQKVTSWTATLISITLFPFFIFVKLLSKPNKILCIFLFFNHGRTRSFRVRFSWTVQSWMLKIFYSLLTVKSSCKYEFLKQIYLNFYWVLVWVNSHPSPATIEIASYRKFQHCKMDSLRNIITSLFSSYFWTQRWHNRLEHSPRKRTVGCSIPAETNLSLSR